MKITLLEKRKEKLISTDDIVEIQDQVYKTKELLIKRLQRIYLREISPWTIYVTSYEKFFGERNPILTENAVH